MVAECDGAGAGDGFLISLRHLRLQVATFSVFAMSRGSSMFFAICVCEWRPSPCLRGRGAKHGMCCAICICEWRPSQWFRVVVALSTVCFAPSAFASGDPLVFAGGRGAKYRMFCAISVCEWRHSPCSRCLVALNTLCVLRHLRSRVATLSVFAVSRGSKHNICFATFALASGDPLGVGESSSGASAGNSTFIVQI